MASIHHITTPLYPPRPTRPAGPTAGEPPADESLTGPTLVATALVGLLTAGALTLLGYTGRLLTELSAIVGG